MSIFKRPKIGLALGSGGARGLAHIGVIKKLVENNIPIDYIAGTSIGALIGGFYAASPDIYRIEKIISTLSVKNFLSMVFDPGIGGGFLKGERVKKFIKSQINDIIFSQLKIPFIAIGTDLQTGKAVEIKNGYVADAIRASISISGVFKPVQINGVHLVDGGLVMPVPAKTVRNMGADIVIAVNLCTDYSKLESDFDNKFKSIIGRSVQIPLYHLAQEDVKSADVVISPKVANVGFINHFLSESKAKEAIIIGEKEASLKINEIKRKMIFNKSIFSFFTKH